MVETKLPAIVIISILIGFLPTWLVYRANKWQFNRKLGTLAANQRAAMAQSTIPTAEPETVLTPAEHPAPVAAEPGPPPVP